MGVILMNKNVRLPNPLYQQYVGEKIPTENINASVGQSLALGTNLGVMYKEVRGQNPQIRSVGIPTQGAASNITTQVNAITLGVGNMVKTFAGQLDTGATRTSARVFQKIGTDINDRGKPYIGGFETLKDNAVLGLRNIVQGPKEAITESVDQTSINIRRRSF